jgi:type IV pilus assembly protein PilE
MRNLTARGFTLIELVVTLAIVGILCTIAWPGYASVMHRSLRLEARLALLRVQQLQERHFASHHRYASSMTAPADADGLQAQALTESGNYELSLQTTADGQAYVAVAHAAPAGRQTRDNACQLFSVDTAGTRRFAGADGRWQGDQGGSCWG